MRFYVRCDICDGEFHCTKMRLPKEIILVDGKDMCDLCWEEYTKRLKKMIKELQKERFGKIQKGRESDENPKK